MQMQSWLSLISIIVSLIAVPTSALLTYHYAKKAFQFQIKRERLIRWTSALDRVISASRQLGSLIKTEAEQRTEKPVAGTIEDDERFKKCAPEIYVAVARWPVCSELQNGMDALKECGIMKRIENKPDTYDKFVSLYLQLKADHIKDQDKVRVSHIVLFNEGLLKNLEAISDSLAYEVSKSAACWLI
mgnify:CR=1 FL=1